MLSQNCTDVTERYKHFFEAHNEACEKLIPKKKKKNIAENPSNGLKTTSKLSPNLVTYHSLATIEV